MWTLLGDLIPLGPDALLPPRFKIIPPPRDPWQPLSCHQYHRHHNFQHHVNYIHYSHWHIPASSHQTLPPNLSLLSSPLVTTNTIIITINQQQQQQKYQHHVHWQVTDQGPWFNPGCKPNMVHLEIMQYNTESANTSQHPTRLITFFQRLPNPREKKHGHGDTQTHRQRKTDTHTSTYRKTTPLCRGLK